MKHQLLKKYLFPTFYFDDIYSLTPQLLRENGINALICDIDNTLVTYDDPLPTSPLLEWIERMTSAGVTIAFASNNSRERVEKFNSELGYFASADSGKPFSRELDNAMRFMGTTSENTAMVGDQLFTDVFAGSRIGLRTVLVKPIKDKTSLFFKFKRALERPILRAYKKHTETK